MEKNKMMMIVIIALLVILLVSVGVVSFFAVRMLSSNGEEAEEQPAQTVGLPLEEIWKYDLANKINSNLAVGPDGNKHIIVASVTLGVNGSDPKDKQYLALIEEIPKNDSVMTSMVVGICRQKTYEELSAPDGQEILQDEILASLQEAFNTNLIVAVYVTMILQ